MLWSLRYRTDAAGVDNLAGGLRTIASRVCHPGTGCRPHVPECPDAIGADQLDPLGKAEPPGPAPWRRAHNAKLGAMHVLERIRHVSVEGNDPGPEIPDERPAGRTKDSADLSQTGSWVGPVVHRQRAEDHVERSVWESHRCNAADEESGAALVPVPRTVCVGSGALGHGLVDVQTGHVEAVPASQQDRQVAGPATHLEHPGALNGDGRDVLGDALEERAQQEAVGERIV